MNIDFVLGTQDQRKVVVNIINKISTLIPMPDHIIVEFKSMGPSSYGETILNPESLHKRIVLNVDLDIKGIFHTTVHELIHVSQIHTGRLTTSRTGVFVWENKTYPVDPLKMSYNDYKKLPWEVDAYEQQQVLAKKLLENQ